MAALLALPGVRQAEAAALLLLELHRPLLPVCLNLLPELQALGWVPQITSESSVCWSVCAHHKRQTLSQ